MDIRRVEERNLIFPKLVVNYHMNGRSGKNRRRRKSGEEGEKKKKIEGKEKGCVNCQERKGLRGACFLVGARVVLFC